MLLKVMDEAHYAIVCDGQPEFDDYDDFSDPLWEILIDTLKSYFEEVTEEDLQEYIALMDNPLIRKVEDATVDAMMSDGFINAQEAISEGLDQRKKLGPPN